ncbi:MAG: hypothetical protein AB1414_10755 [bacterium]
MSPEFGLNLESSKYRPEITLYKSVDKASTLPGETLTYTITYKNEGQGTAKDVSIIDVLPEHCVLKSIVHSPQSIVSYWYNNGWQTDFNEVATKIRWIIDEVGPGQSGSVSFTVRVK